MSINNFFKISPFLPVAGEAAASPRHLPGPVVPGLGGRGGEDEEEGRGHEAGPCHAHCHVSRVTCPLVTSSRGACPPPTAAIRQPADSFHNSATAVNSSGSALVVRLYRHRTAPLVQILSAELNLLSCPGQTAADWQCRNIHFGAQIITHAKSRYPSTSCTCTSESMAPSCRSMTFSAPLCCSVVQDTRAVHPHTTTTTTTTAMIPALCASCRGKGWRLFSPLALTLAESWCTLHAGSWYLIGA